ncbi:hypothetical protein JAAARDRAFT_237611 [Jaapia argillacea MUCL 33604]|uniref:F-box domain-containing protein n=1 Tax=Jaapia argillacea MUCL 33604 TaxID=933084 RepID=A0A067QML0_9AGAM|nr:hypothetical protein JAAARDRAFT_237611 [Jaapia argillacea MUCL 33604]
MSDIDEEIRSSLERLRALRENRNELVPISRLPLDIFLVIFSFCGVDASASKARSATLWRTPAAVCRRWREIALSYRSLWPADTRELVFQRFAKSRTLSPANPPSLPLVLNFPEVNKQIKKQVQHIRRLRAARYREAPISRLPPSLLCKIFTLCSNIPFEDRGERLSWEHRSLYWLTRVCHRWRQVAYGHPLLWNRIVTWDPPWIKKILTRSRDLNHALIIDWTEDFPGSCHLPLVLQEVSRVQSVTLRGSGSTLTRMFETLQSRQATELESLTLMDHRPRFHTIEDPPPSKPLGIFRLATPKLRTLSVSGFNIAWDSSLLRSSTLVNLALHRSTFGYPPTLTQLLDILDRTPRLETLTLGDLLPSKPYGVTYHQERWVRNMPHLKKIVLYSSCDSSVSK